MQQAVEHILELVHHLHLVEDHVRRQPVSGNARPQERKQRIRIAQGLVRAIVESHLYDVSLVHATLEQVSVEELEEKVGLAAPANARDGLDESVSSTFHEPPQIAVPSYFHGDPIPNFCVLTHFLGIV